MHKRRVCGPLIAISSAPLLYSICGCGFTLYGRSDYDSETRSYATTYYFVALFVPILPVGRYRVIDTGKGRFSFLGKLPLRTADRWHFVIALAVFIATISLGVTSLSEKSNSVSAPTSSFSIDAKKLEEVDPHTVAPIKPPTNSSEDGQGSAPEVRNPQLFDLKVRIESDRARLATLAARLQPVFERLSRLNARQKILDAELHALDEQSEVGVEVNIDEYNANVKAHNRVSGKWRSLFTANKSDLRTYLDASKRLSALVALYKIIHASH
jgi:hypothetical protein